MVAKIVVPPRQWQKRRALGVDASAAMGNVGVRQEAELIITRPQTPDILINNAAIRPHGPFLEIENNDWQNVISVNMNGPIWLARAALPSAVKNGLGTRDPLYRHECAKGLPRCGLRLSLKTCLWGLTKALAVDLDLGITSNIISPGTFPPDDADMENPGSNKNYQQLLNDNPSGRLAGPVILVE